jgi:predicted dienelactone hydrolase
MRLFFLTLIQLFFIGHLSAQYAIGETQLSFTDASRSNRTIDVEVFYPANAVGTNVAIASGQFPVLVFGHGFLMTYDAYDVLWQALVPEGYIMVLPTTEGGFSPSHSDFGQDIAFLVGAMKQEATDNSSIFYNAVANESAAMGHSMGGGSAFLSMQYDSSITALVTLAAAETNPSAVSAAAGIQKPALVIAGANDCVTPPAQHQDLMYNALASSSKHQTTIIGASHCQFGSPNFFCTTGELTCSPSAAISAAQQQAIAADLMLPFLDHYLKNDCAAANQFQAYVDSATTLTSNQSVTLSCSTTGLDVFNSRDFVFKLYPNPSRGVTYLDVSEDALGGHLFIYNNLGQLIHQEVLNSQNQQLPSLKAGVYQVALRAKNGLMLGQKSCLVVD